MINRALRRILFMIFLLAFASWSSGRAIDRTIAKINTTILTESDLAQVIADLAGLHRTTGINAFEDATSGTVASMLDRALLLQEAERLHIKPPNDELHRQVESMAAEIKQNFASETEFYQALAEEKLSLDQLKEQLLKQTRDDFMVYHVVDSRFSLSDDEVKNSSPAEGQPTGSSYRLRRLGIAISKKLPAAEASRKAHATVARTITEGISFEEGVRRYSEVPGAAQDGGDMGYVSTDALSDDVRQAVQTLTVGQASAPIVAGGYANVFYVEGKRGERVALREKKFIETRNDLLVSLRRRAVLHVYDDRLMPLLTPDYVQRVSGRPGAAQPTVDVRSEAPLPRMTPAQYQPPVATAPASQNYSPAPYATPAPTAAPQGERRPFWNWGRQRQ